MKHISFGSIGDIKQCAKALTLRVQYVGTDQLTGKAVYDKTKKAPTVTVMLTEKINGTNASFSYDANTGDWWVNSRERVLSLENDNAGGYAFCLKHLAIFSKIVGHLLPVNEIITIPFEFAGEGIQKKTALTGLPKKAIIFPYYKATKGDVGIWYELPCIPVDSTEEIEFIRRVPDAVQYISIDFNNVQSRINKLLELVATVEESSPLGRYYGVENNIGEGWVGHFFYENELYRFKVKGTKHANSKVKVLQPIDDVKEQAKQDFVAFALPAWRLEQMSEGCYGPDDTGRFMKALHTDVLKECSQELVDAGLAWKEVVQLLSKQAREWYNEYI